MTKNKKRELYNYCVAVATKGMYNMYNETPPTFEEWDRHITRSEENRVNNNINIRDFVEQELFLFEQDALGDGRKDLIIELADAINKYQGCTDINLNSDSKIPHIKLNDNVGFGSYITYIAIIDAFYNWSCPELHEN